MRRLLIPSSVLLLCVVGSLALISRPPREVRICAFSTSLDGRLPSQRHNAILAIRKLDGAVVNAGEEFSFNKRVGTWSRYDGYQKAPVSYGGQLIRAWGGGVCQASSTLYNAALQSGMEITERHPHHFAPAYVRPGRDAAVAYSNIDLSFTNPYPWPVRIAAKHSGDRIFIEFFGRETPETKYEIVQDLLQVSSPRTILVPSDAGGGVVHPGKPGFSVRTYRVTRIGSKSKREFLSADSYPVAERIIMQTR